MKKLFEGLKSSDLFKPVDDTEASRREDLLMEKNKEAFLKLYEIDCQLGDVIREKTPREYNKTKLVELIDWNTAIPGRNGYASISRNLATVDIINGMRLEMFISRKSHTDPMTTVDKVKKAAAIIKPASLIMKKVFGEYKHSPSTYQDAQLYLKWVQNAKDL